MNKAFIKIISFVSVISALICLFGLGWVLKDQWTEAKTISPQKQTAKTTKITTNHQLQIAALGDSLTRGTGDPEGKGYVGYLIDGLEKKAHKKFLLTNSAIKGQTSKQLLSQIKQTEIQRQIKQADLILLTIGGNDLFQGGEALMNGAGKTTTIRMLVGLIKPTSGSIYIAGKNVETEFKEAMKNLGCIVENPELYPYLSGWENLEYFARMDPSISNERLHHVTELVGLTNRIHDRVKTYSLGMRQRLGIAQALLGNPHLLILDEPTNGLDPAGIREMREFIRYLATEEGLSVLVSSHLLSEIQLLCDRVAIITNGEIIRTDTVSSLFTDKERVIWNVTPMEKAKQLLAEVTTVKEGEDESLITPFNSNEIAGWNKRLVEADVEVKEMKTVFPTLEELFLEITGGNAID